MIIGLDFDNTIVRYDNAFYQVALERGLIGEDVPVSKLAVRDALRAAGKNDVWTEMQGYVYGCRMDMAGLFDGVADFVQKAHGQGGRCLVISHKTRKPYAGPAYDLHKAAREWISGNLVDGHGAPLIPESDVTFHETKEQKLGYAAAQGCAVFLDDLPEILRHERFPKTARPVLFDPEGHHEDQDSLERVRSWEEFRKSLGL